MESSISTSNSVSLQSSSLSSNSTYCPKNLLQLAKAVGRAALGVIAYVFNFVTCKYFTSLGPFANEQFATSKRLYYAVFPKKSFPSQSKSGERPFTKSQQILNPNAPKNSSSLSSSLSPSPLNESLSSKSHANADEHKRSISSIKETPNTFKPEAPKNSSSSLSSVNSSSLSDRSFTTSDVATDKRKQSISPTNEISNPLPVSPPKNPIVSSNQSTFSESKDDSNASSMPKQTSEAETPTNSILPSSHRSPLNDFSVNTEKQEKSNSPTDEDQNLFDISQEKSTEVFLKHTSSFESGSSPRTSPQGDQSEAPSSSVVLFPENLGHSASLSLNALDLNGAKFNPSISIISSLNPSFSCSNVSQKDDSKVEQTLPFPDSSATDSSQLSPILHLDVSPIRFPTSNGRSPATTPLYVRKSPEIEPFDLNRVDPTIEAQPTKRRKLDQSTSVDNLASPPNFNSSASASAPSVALHKKIPMLPSPYKSRASVISLPQEENKDRASAIPLPQEENIEANRKKILTKIFEGINENCTVGQDGPTELAAWPDHPQKPNPCFVRMSIGEDDSELLFEEDSSCIPNRDCEIFGCFNKPTDSIQDMLYEKVEPLYKTGDLNDEAIVNIFEELCKASGKSSSFSLAFRYKHQLWIGTTENLIAPVLGKNQVKPELLARKDANLKIIAYRNIKELQGNHLILANESLSKIYPEEADLEFLQIVAKGDETIGTDLLWFIIANPVKKEFNRLEKPLEIILEESLHKYSAMVLTLPSFEERDEIESNFKLFSSSDSETSEILEEDAKGKSPIIEDSSPLEQEVLEKESESESSSLLDSEISETSDEDTKGKKESLSPQRQEVQQTYHFSPSPSHYSLSRRGSLPLIIREPSLTPGEKKKTLAKMLDISPVRETKGVIASQEPLVLFKYKEAVGDFNVCTQAKTDQKCFIWAPTTGNGLSKHIVPCAITEPRSGISYFEILNTVDPNRFSIDETYQLFMMHFFTPLNKLKSLNKEAIQDCFESACKQFLLYHTNLSAISSTIALLLKDQLWIASPKNINAILVNREGAELPKPETITGENINSHFYENLSQLKGASLILYSPAISQRMEQKKLTQGILEHPEHSLSDVTRNIAYSAKHNTDQDLCVIALQL